MPKIILSKDDQVLKEFALNKERITIGRRPHNDIVIEHRAISAEHAAIITILNDSFLEDLNSTNGTSINGQPISKHFLQHNDIVEIARYKMRFIADSSLKATGFSGSDNPEHQHKHVSSSIQSNGQLKSTDHSLLMGLMAENLSSGIAAAKIVVLSGASAGTELLLNKNLITMGRPGVQVAVITRRAENYFITHVEGEDYPLLNGDSIGTSAHGLKNGDVIDLSGTEMRFSVS